MGAGAYLNRNRQPTEYEIFVFPIDIDPLLEQANAVAKTMDSAVQGAGRHPLQVPQKVDDGLKGVTNVDTFGFYSLAASMRKGVQQYKLLGAGGLAYIKEIRGKEYIIFKGFAGARPNLSGTKYLKTNPKVACFVVGAKDILEDAGNATKLAVFVYVAFDIYKEVVSDKPSMADLGVHVASDVAQAATAAVIGAEAGIFVLAVWGTPVVVTFAVVVAVGFAVGIGLSWIDTKYHLTDRCADFFRKMEEDPSSVLYKVEHGVHAAVSWFWSSAEAMAASYPVGAYQYMSLP
jgi:hypothetical protein